MGCYGIGVTRIVGAAIEQNHDERGIIFPRAIAPFEIAIAPVGYGKSGAVRSAAETLYEELKAAGLDVLLDDRDERPGVMFADLELIGVPHRITIGERGLKEGMVEYQERRDAAVAAFRANGFAVEAPKASMYLWVPLPAGIKSLEFHERLMAEEGVIVLAGSSLGAGGEGFFRISFITSPARIAEAAERAGRLLARMQA